MHPAYGRARPQSGQNPRLLNVSRRTDPNRFTSCGWVEVIRMTFVTGTGQPRTRHDFMTRGPGNRGVSDMVETLRLVAVPESRVI
jgi:hypothetical protein